MTGSLYSSILNSIGEGKMQKIVDRRNLDFLLYEVFDFDKILEMEKFKEFDREAIESILDLTQSIAEEKLLPCASALDANEPKFVNGKVEIMPEVGDALKVCADAGLFCANFPEDVGGMGIPATLNIMSQGILFAANIGIANYLFLTVGNAHMLNEFGTTKQKKLFLDKMLKGEWFGTMCLSEPHAGSSLADIKTYAMPVSEDLYSISGSKMWISGGDHEISQNIIHMVLAKLPNAPSGVHGISLFIVPKFRVDDEGNLGEFNNIALAGLNHKMGQRGITNCLLNFGENGDTLGYLIGEPNKGLQYMFHMMNEARIGVGAGSTMSGLAGYLYSLDYAKTRLQGRKIGNKNSDNMVPIIEHADVKKMLMEQKTSVEGAHALLIYCGILLDKIATTNDTQEKTKLHLILELLTPIAKSWPSEHCLEANKWAIQILGGYGYTRDYPVERYYRDNRLNHIHEGTYGIHGLDILGRKVRIENGLPLRLLIDEIEKDITMGVGIFDNEITALRDVIAIMQEATAAAINLSNQEIALANATQYLDAFGNMVIGWLWLKQAIAAQTIRTNNLNKEFYDGKILACKYFFTHRLPKAKLDFEIIAKFDDICVSTTAEHFVS